MSYEVTATKRRPQTFDQLVGQDFVVATIKNSLRSGRIAHAFLFSGPRGVGKTSAARILAKALNCPDGPDADGCPDYPGSEEIARGTSLDVIEIDGASNTGVNDVRQIKDEVLFAPNSSRYKIYIIDEVHMLSNSAFNALLKTIEEPPPYVVFIFATTEIHKVPATIRSRCQQFSFRLIENEIIVDLLTEASAEIGVESEHDALAWIAKEATGSLRDAYTLFDQVVAFSGGTITVAEIRKKFGLLGIDRINTLAEHLFRGDATAALTIVHDGIQSGVTVERLVTDLADYYRALLLMKNGITRESVLGFAPDRYPATVREQYSVSQLERANEILLQLFRNLRFTVNQQFEVELALSRLSSLSSFVYPQELVARIEALRNTLPETAHAAVSEVQEERADPEEQNNPEIEPDFDGITAEQVEQLIRRFRSSRISVASILSRASLWKLQDTELVLAFASNFDVSTASQEREEILSEATEVFGIPGLRVVVRTLAEQQNAAITSAADPDVEMVRQVFRGEVLEDTI